MVFGRGPKKYFSEKKKTHVLADKYKHAPPELRLVAFSWPIVPNVDGHFRKISVSMFHPVHQHIVVLRVVQYLYLYIDYRDLAIFYKYGWRRTDRVSWHGDCFVGSGDQEKVLTNARSLTNKDPRVSATLQRLLDIGFRTPKNVGGQQHLGARSQWHRGRAPNGQQRVRIEQGPRPAKKNVSPAQGPRSRTRTVWSKRTEAICQVLCLHNVVCLSVPCMSSNTPARPRQRPPQQRLSESARKTVMHREELRSAGRAEAPRRAIESRAYQARNSRRRQQRAEQEARQRLQFSDW